MSDNSNRPDPGQEKDYDLEFREGRDISGRFSTPQKVLIGLQHTMAMLGATVLVPVITGLNVSATLFAVGVGTLIFHFFTKGRVPGFLGSSFAFIAPLLIAAETLSLQHAQAGIIGAGIVYVLVGLLVQWIGPERVAKVFPPIVTGPVIMVIGLGLAPVAMGMAGGHWGVAVLTLLAAVGITMFGKGIIKVVPILGGLVIGYIAATFLGLVDFSGIAQASFIGLPGFTLPKFSPQVLLIVTPAAIVSVIEHIGDILAIGNTIDRDMKTDPGIAPTLYGGGVATIISGLLGGPSLTTYGENIGVLAITRVHATFVVSMGAIWAIVMAFIPKVEALIQSIPGPVIGGVSILLYGMIAGVGIRTLIEGKVSLIKPRNLIIASVILVIGVGGVAFTVVEGLELSAMVLAAVTGIILNQVLPQEA
ncbi:uracil permease [Alkalispirochaeta americana]|uniref:Uracil permease n=1 Tax=Alkalispirochaeta americana TaxID=159291 RepID=A0A1N6Q787_9SPIO|nr:solute carrier family 23 protein [Alkalispirochaeta americana]SIQ12430.1 uracil permease [Alkalispirochaeta americana]